MYRHTRWTLLFLGLLATAALADGDPEAGRRKSSMCAGCHGIYGYRNAYPEYRVPKLGGQHAQYLASALRAYKAGDRSHPTMRAIVLREAKSGAAGQAGPDRRHDGDLLAGDAPPPRSKRPTSRSWPMMTSPR